MSTTQYAFIDLAVLDDVRERFSHGRPIAILSEDLQTLIWANGAAARLFGYDDIGSAMDSPANLTASARRQIMSLPGFPDVGKNRTIMVRIAEGLAQRPPFYELSALMLPNGERAILLARPDLDASSSAVPLDALSGFREAGYVAALIDAQGNTIATTGDDASPHFDRPQLLALIESVGGGKDRLVKRMTETEFGMLPVGFARLVDEPALHLLVTIAEMPADDTTEDRARASQAIEDQPQEAPGLPEQTVPAAPPIRFTWNTDAETRFSAVSAEFAEAVGTSAADIVGRTFRDVATVFAFDADNAVADLLDSHVTWSGRSVLWPIEGQSRRMPVDLAALPLFDRSRQFLGFKGFGVARPDDAVDDPEGIGLALTPDFVPPMIVVVHEPVEVDDGDDPFYGETPALDIVTGQGRRQSDKVVVLQDHRPPPQRSLSTGEQQAFQEIGEKLRTHTDDGEEEPAATTEEHGGEDDEQFDDERRRQERARFEQRIEAELASATARIIKRQNDDAEVEALPENVVRLVDAVRSDEPTVQTDRTAKDDVADNARAGIAYLPSAFAVEKPQLGAQHAAESVLLDDLPLPILVHAGDVLHYANSAFLELTGHASIQDILAAGGLGGLFPEEAASQEIGDTPIPAGAMLLSKADGTEMAVYAHLHSTRWADGTALMLTLTPVPEVDAANEPSTTAADEELTKENDKLRELIRQMQTIVDTATDGVILIAPDRTIRSISRPAEALFGIDSETVTGEPFVALFAMESQRAADDYLSRLDANGVASLLNDGREVIGREAEGGFIPLFMTVGRLPHDSGYCAVLRDITHWKRAEEDLTQARTQAERASSQKSEFLARISHEIRTPLNAIIGFSELMINESFGPIGTDRYRDYLRDINRSGNHVLDLVNDLLDISKIEAGEQEMNYEAVSLNDVLGEAVAMMQPQANRDRVIIRSSFASKLPEIVADLRSVRQIALNLLSNAVRYTLAGGQVIISTSHESNGDIVFRVRDTGIGMSAADIDQALKPFKRVNSLKRSQREGTGLGLPLTKAMVEANRARFAISSMPKEGTLVEIIFPATRVLAD